MTKLSARFELLSGRGEKALVLFFTAGDQPLAELPEIIAALAEGGADVIEIGVPFSDPFGEGPTIQASSQRSLDRGTNPSAILQAVARRALDVPIVTMGYYNPILRAGLAEFARASAAAGVSGTIVSDLIPDEADAWVQASREAGLDTIFLVAPTSTEQRIRDVAARTTGFVYAVSRTGVTGAERAAPPEVSDLIARVRAQTDKPVCVGFGISRPEHVAMVCQVADGAVVGSYIVDLLHRVWHGGAGRAEVVAAVRELKAAAR